MQLGLELMAGLGRQLKLAESDDEAPIWVIAGIKRTVNGNKEVAK